MVHATARKRILIVSRNFPPVVGGIEKLMHRLATGLSDRYECVIIGPNGCRSSLSSTAKVIEIPHSPAALFLIAATLISSYLMLRNRFHAAVAGNGLMVATLLPVARIRSIPVVSMIYGLDIVAPNPIYQSIFVPMIRRSSAVIACSENTARLARAHHVPERLVNTIIPAVDPPAVEFDEPPVAYQAPRRPTLISVGRLVPRKGIADFIRNSLPIIVANVPDVRMVIIGTPPKKALKRDTSELERIKDAIEATKMEEHVQLLGYLPDGAVAAWMSLADAHVFPIKDSPNDVEGFGLVALEAASFGVPTIAFNAGGVSDAVKPGVSGFLVEPDNYKAFAEQTLAVLAEPPGSFRTACKEYAASCSWTSYADRVAKIIEHAAAHN